MNDGNKHLVLHIPLILILFFSSAATGSAVTDNPAVLFEQANKSYSEGHFVDASSQYEDIIRNYGLSAPILYNLGNSYAQSSQPGKAVLSYMRALRLSPNDPDIKGNLQLLRKEQGLFQTEKSIIEQIVNLLEMDRWSLLAGGAFGFLTLLHLLALFIPINKKTTWGLSALLALITLSSALCTYTRYQDFNDGVVVNSDVHLLISPFESAKSSGKLQEGRVIRPSKLHGEYYLVEDRSGRSGWLHQDDFELIATRL